MRRIDKEIKGRAEKEEALRIIMQHYGGPAPDFEAAGVDKVLIIKIQINTLSGKRSG